MVAQNSLPFKWEAEQNSTGLTAWAGLPVFLDVMATLGLPTEVTESIGLRPDQGWSDIQQITALVALNLVGGECLDDLRRLEADDGLCAVLERLEAHRLRPKARKAVEARIRRGGERTFPSPSSAREYLESFEPEEPTTKAAGEQGARIPEPTEALEGLREVVSVPVRYSKLRPQDETSATLDVDATLIESANRSAKHCYQGHRAYQPLNVYWFERRQVVFSEFRDGNCPAGWRVQEVVEAALDHLPASIETLRLRSDTAAYQGEFLRTMADPKRDGTPDMDFAVGVRMGEAFKKCCLDVDEDEWEPYSKVDEDGEAHQTMREFTQVPFVPNWLAQTKRDLGIRFLAIREPLAQKELPGVDGEEDGQQDLPFPTLEFEADGYKIQGIVTNRSLDDQAVLQWYYERCGRSEHAHGEWKEALGAGQLPSSDDFQANAAWWQIALLAWNLEVLTQRDFLRQRHGPLMRLKRLRFKLICVPGRVVTHARQMTIRVPEGHPSLAVIREIRGLAEMFRRGPPTPWLKPAA